LPSFSNSFEVVLLQFLLVYNIVLLFCSTSLFYVLFYLFLEIIYFGFFLSLYQFELFSAFLWLAESVVIFVSFLLLFYISVYDNTNNINVEVFNKKMSILFFVIFLLALLFIYPSESEFFLPIELQLNLFWDDFYEALYNDKMNDLFGLMLSFYFFNSFEFLIIGFLLLVGSIICVNLHRFLRLSKSYNYDKFFSFFDSLKDSINFLFLRKQNLVNQEVTPSSTRVFKRK
jgi:hypothetical protein